MGQNNRIDWIGHNELIKKAKFFLKKYAGALSIKENVDISITNSIIKNNALGYLLFPFPDYDNDPHPTYCNKVKEDLNQLKEDNILCGNNHDTHSICSFITEPECNF